jgi:hypothetical protein
MSESTKPVGDRRAVVPSRGNWRNIIDAGHREGQAGNIEPGVWPRGTSLGITVNLCSSDVAVEASASGSDHHEVLEKIEALKQIALRCVEPLLTDGAGI